MIKKSTMKLFNNSINAIGKGWALIVIGLIIMYVPPYFQALIASWSRSSDSYIWLVLLIAGYLFYKERNYLTTRRPNPRTSAETFFSIMIYSVGLFSYVIGRSQGIISLTLGSLVFTCVGLILFFKGAHIVKKYWFALFFLVFTVPMPSYLLDPITLPMKILVSISTEWILSHAGLLVARDGVILQVERYQLFVADACAGMKTLLSLEAMGLLYLHLVKHDSWQRNLLLGVLIIPISLLANVIRVTMLALITYSLGEAAGRGFMHAYAGILLFLVALSLIMTIDHLIQSAFEKPHAKS